MKGTSGVSYAALLDPQNLLRHAIENLDTPETPELDTTGVDRVIRRLGIGTEPGIEGFTAKAHELAMGPCKPRNPGCHECPLARFCPEGRRSQGSVTSVDNFAMVDLFSGAGGMSLGFERAGFHPVYAADHDAASVATYRFNRPAVPVDSIECADLAGSLTPVGEVDLLIGGPPCQGFSNANRQMAISDPRNSLYRAFVRGISTYAPRLVVLENVPGIARHRTTIQHDFSKAGFLVEPFLLDAADLGLPQRRKRLFWLGVPDSSSAPRLFSRFEASLASRSGGGSFTLRDAIGNLPPLERQTRSNATGHESRKTGYMMTRWQSTKTNAYQRLLGNEASVAWLFNHKSKFLNDRDAAIYRRLAPGETSDAEWFSRVDPYPNRRHIFKDKFSRLSWDEPARTMTAHMYYDCHMYIHPSQARGLTPREAARVQGFPDDYLFLGYPNEWYRQIGNAVSPLVAEAVARAVVDVLDASRTRGVA